MGRSKDVAPSVTAVFDQPAGGYAVGDTATLTVTRPAGVPLSAVVSVLGFADIQISATVKALPVTVTAKDGRTYTPASDDGVTAKLTTKV